MIRLKAYAKINLALQVLGKRLDSYHEIDSIMQSVSLFDSIELNKIDSGINLTISDPSLPIDQKNIAYKAAELFFNETGIDPLINISITKMIPIAAGLAGGSADAAAVFVGLNELYKTKMSIGDLQALASRIGSDISFCLVGGTCKCRGRGEIVEPITNLQLPLSNYFVLVKPDFPVSTKWVYENYKGEKQNPLDSISLVNDLEKVVLPKYPEVADIKKKLIQNGCQQSLMSGSGPTVFGLAPDEATAKKVYGIMKGKYKQTFIVEPVDQGIEIIG